MSDTEHTVVPWSLELHPREGVELLVKLSGGLGQGGSPMQVPENTHTRDPLLLAFARLHRTAFAFASGVVLGGLLSVATLAMVVSKTYPRPDLELFAQFFWGYSVTWPGVFLGFVWGFASGFALGWGFALIRNITFWVWLTLVRSRAEMEQYSDFLDHL